jgi:hypothetical protein
VHAEGPAGPRGGPAVARDVGVEARGGRHGMDQCAQGDDDGRWKDRMGYYIVIG